MSVAVDWKAFRERVNFAIQHHGTNTNGEDFRRDQVAAYITEMTIQMFSVVNAANTALDAEPRSTPVFFKVAPT